MASPKFRFGGGHSTKLYSTNTFENFLNLILKFAQNFKNFSKIIQEYNLSKFKKFSIIFVNIYNILNK